MANTDVLQVVALALFHPVRKRYLIVRRNAKQNSGAGHWEFPGGKIESGESHTQALVREILEELGFTIKESALSFIHSNKYQYPQRMVEIHLYRYERAIDEFLLVDHDQHAWVDESEISTFDLAPADIPFIKHLYKN
ncbi:(deoxy)nucleoside triphosphate pyrophosphohydrolase [Pseudobdellovibrio sp. HCB154]|uniref:(deoxy)nucleoside triphosphate pyrophosphohydrolase n=1 Tax=Pseudobdellovibrio sp. HCB154 TaxID=3386277 RepID=UPI003916F178